MSAADRILARCAQLNWSISTAESVSAGGIALALSRVPGASSVLRGGVVAYDTHVKVDLLHVSPALATHVVSQSVAEAMAQGAVNLFGSSIAIATTGVAGPDPLDNQPPGTIWCAIALPDARIHAVQWQLSGSRTDIQDACIEQALAWLATVVDESI
jgi:nicotinamide-nucleotide amidase